ncbi:MAG TPA: hypothetical protein VKW06_21045 [Candidatus Angelobacter sp.]|nr:hypothetical protein [Candidatus Angelobacter sp.]
MNTTPPNPSGFTNASLNGTYAFAFTGNNGGGFFTVAGSFTANGAGAITGGTEDINSPGTGLIAPAVSITGSYNVRSDGRTVATINSTSLNPGVSFGLDLVILNPQKALVMRFDQNGSASGTIDLQTSSAFSFSSVAGAYAFNVAGVDGSGNSDGSVGLLNADNAGNITSGTLDNNDNFTVTTNQPLTPTTYTAPAAGTGRGTATITTSTLGTRNFAYYVVDANHLKLIETDNAGPFLSGDAFRQTSTAVSGSFVFTMAGATINGHGVFLAGGVLNTDGAGNVQSTSIEDIDNGGGLTAAGGVSVSGTYAVSGGRGTMQLNNGATTLNLVFYPSSGGLQMLDVDAGAIAAGGAALQQSGAPFSNGSINNGYGLNFTGILGPNSLSPTEIDAISQFNATGSGSLSGALDVNSFGALTSNLALNGSYSVSANGRGTASLRTSQGTINLIFYMAGSSQVLFVEMDEGFGQLSVGGFAAQ